MLEQVQSAVRRGEWEEARRLLERELERNPGQPELYRHLARVCEAMGDWDATEQALHRYLVAYPDHGESHFWLGRVLEKQGRVGEAEAAYRRVLELEPGHQAGRSALDHLLAQQPADIVEHRLRKAVASALSEMPEFSDAEEAPPTAEPPIAPAQRLPSGWSWLQSGWPWRLSVLLAAGSILVALFLPQRPRRPEQTPSDWLQATTFRSPSSPFRAGVRASESTSQPPDAVTGAQPQAGGLATEQQAGPAGQGLPSLSSSADQQTSIIQPDPHLLRQSVREQEGASALGDWLSQAITAGPASIAHPNVAADNGQQHDVESPEPASAFKEAEEAGPVSPFPGSTNGPAEGSRPSGSGQTGRGLTLCPECGGQGARPDPQCGGTGLLACPGPAGGTTVGTAVRCVEGRVVCSLHFGENCQICDGQDGQICSVCQGRGALNCPACNGTGVLRCPTCGGRGQILP